MNSSPRPQDLPQAESYPPYVVSEDEKLRWDLAWAIAEDIFGGDGDPGAVWMATRSIYKSEIPTTPKPRPQAAG